MKTEFEIAKEKIDEIAFFERDGSRDREGRAEALGIKQSSQRFLEFLDYCLSELIIPKNILKVFETKITDLKQAIKLYDENGI